MHTISTSWKDLSMTVTPTSLQDRALEALNQANDQLDEAVGQREGQIVLVPGELVQFPTHWRPDDVDLGDGTLYAAIQVGEIVILESRLVGQVRYRDDDGNIIPDTVFNLIPPDDFTRRMGGFEGQFGTRGTMLGFVGSNGFQAMDAYTDGKHTQWANAMHIWEVQQLNCNINAVEAYRQVLLEGAYEEIKYGMGTPSEPDHYQRRETLWKLGAPVPPEIPQTVDHFQEVRNARYASGLRLDMLTLNASPGTDTRKPGFLDPLSAVEDNFRMDEVTQLIVKGERSVESQWEGIEGESAQTQPSIADHRRNRNRLVTVLTGWKWDKSNRGAVGYTRFPKRAGAPELSVVDVQGDSRHFTFIQSRQAAEGAEAVPALTAPATEDYDGAF